MTASIYLQIWGFPSLAITLCDCTYLLLLAIAATTHFAVHRRGTHPKFNMGPMQPDGLLPRLTWDGLSAVSFLVLLPPLPLLVAAHQSPVPLGIAIPAAAASTLLSVPSFAILLLGWDKGRWFAGGCCDRI